MPRPGRLFTFFRHRVRARKPNSLVLRAGVREPNQSPGHFFTFFRHRVRARKPNSLALRTGEREPNRGPGSISLFSRHKVRARKPSSLALRAGVREPNQSPGHFFTFFRHRVRARKPNSLALRTDERKLLPHAAPGPPANPLHKKGKQRFQNRNRCSLSLGNYLIGYISFKVSSVTNPCCYALFLRRVTARLAHADRNSTTIPMKPLV